MLYDPKWQKSADVFSLDGLIGWLEGQDASREYRWSGSNCLLCQYLAFHGHDVGKYGEFPIDLRRTIVHPSSGDQTFGAALERARAAKNTP